MTRAPAGFTTGDDVRFSHDRPKRHSPRSERISMRSLVRSVLHRDSNRRQRELDRLAPNSPANNDLYIVEFPKSGITWLCTLVTNFFLLEKGSENLRASHFNLELFGGDVHQSDTLYAHPVFNGLRVIKSHAPDHPQYRHVIYLIRNPLSVMTSYFHFATGRGEFAGTFREFIEHPRFGVDSWVRHVQSWTSPPKQLKLHLIRYEDLQYDAVSALASLLASLGYRAPGERLHAAVQLSSFDEMRRDTDHYRAHCPFRHYEFVREGSTKTQLPAEDRDLILERAGAVVARFFPELSQDDLNRGSER